MLDAEVEYLPQEGECAVRHDRGATVRDGVYEADYIPAADFAYVQVPERIQNILVDDPDILGGASLFARMAVDVLLAGAVDGKCERRRCNEGCCSFHDAMALAPKIEAPLALVIEGRGRRSERPGTLLTIWRSCSTPAEQPGSAREQC